MSEGTVTTGARVWAIETPAWLAHEDRILHWVVSAEQSLAWHYHMLLTGFTLKRTNSGWKLIVHSLALFEDRDPKPQVAFVDGATMFDALENFALQLKRGQISWHPDRWPPFARSEED